MTQALLTINQLTIGFGGSNSFTPVVSDLELSLNPGQCLGLVGESGSGKSMTALAIMQLLPVTASVTDHSEIWFQGKNILNVSQRAMRRIRGRRMGMIFQDAMSALNPVLTIGQQIVEVLQAHQHLRGRKAKKRAFALLDEVGIPDPKQCYQSYPHQLSGGMRQRAMVAKSCC